MRKLKQGEKEQKSKPKNVRIHLIIPEWIDEKLEQTAQNMGLSKSSTAIDLMYHGWKIVEMPIGLYLTAEK